MPCISYRGRRLPCFSTLVNCKFNYYVLLPWYVSTLQTVILTDSWLIRLIDFKIKETFFFLIRSWEKKDAFLIFKLVIFNVSCDLYNKLIVSFVQFLISHLKTPLTLLCEIWITAFPVVSCRSGTRAEHVRSRKQISHDYCLFRTF